MGRELPKKGDPLVYVDRDGIEFDAFIAGIDATKGLTIHILDIERAEKEGYRWYEDEVKGEMFCINFADPVPGTHMHKAFNEAVKAIKAGKLDIKKHYGAIGFGNTAASGRMVSCAFR